MCKSCHNCIRILMMIFNFIFVLCGLGLFSLALYFYLGTFFKNMGSDGTSMLIVFYVTMGIGALTLIVGALGCCGAYHESPCLLGTYFVFLLIIFAVEIAGGVLCYKYSGQVQTSIGIAFDRGTNELIDKADYTEHWMIEAQKMLKCCGANGPNDYNKLGKKLPNSCCEEKCEFNEASPVKNYKRDGCKKAWDNIVETKWMIFAGTLLGIALVELLGLIFSLCLYCSARNLVYNVVETRA